MPITFSAISSAAGLTHRYGRPVSTAFAPKGSAFNPPVPHLMPPPRESGFARQVLPNGKLPVYPSVVRFEVVLVAECVEKGWSHIPYHRQCSLLLYLFVLSLITHRRLVNTTASVTLRAFRQGKTRSVIRMIDFMLRQTSCCIAAVRRWANPHTDNGAFRFHA
jgi:hypothetical protein